MGRCWRPGPWSLSTDRGPLGRSTALVSVRMGGLDRVGMKVVFGSSLSGVKLSGFRGRGDSVEVAIDIHARRSGTGTCNVQFVGHGRSVTGVGTVLVERADPVLVEVRGVLGTTNLGVPHPRQHAMP